MSLTRVERLINKHNEITGECSFFYPNKKSNNLNDYNKVENCIVFRDNKRYEEKMIGYVQMKSSTNDTLETNNPLSDFMFFTLGTFFLVDGQKNRDYDKLVIQQSGEYYQVNRASINEYNSVVSGECQKKDFYNDINEVDFIDGEENVEEKKIASQVVVLSVLSNLAILENDKTLNLNGKEYIIPEGIYIGETLKNLLVDILDEFVITHNQVVTNIVGNENINYFIRIEKAVVDYEKSTLLQKDNNTERNTGVYLK